MTDEVEKRILEMVADIEAKGEMAVLSDQGYFRYIFNQSIERYSRQIGEGKLKVVGVNIHEGPSEECTLLKEVVQQKIDPCRERTAQIKAFKENRDIARVVQALQNVHNQASLPGVNLVPAVIDAMEACATMGEVAGTLRMAYGYPYDPHNMVTLPIEGGHR